MNTLVSALLMSIILCYEGELVEAVVPYMGESITDGTIATFLRSKFLRFVESVFVNI